MQKTTLIIATLTLLLGAGGGYAYGTSVQPDVRDSMEMHSEADSQNAMAMEDHAHEMYNVADPTYAPTVTLEVTKDPKSGYNVFVQTTNFTFTPENTGDAIVENEGHAHLYVNGEKIARMYGAWHHIELLEPGENVIRVALNTNDHLEYAINDESIEAMTTITVSEEEHNEIPHAH